MLPLVHILTQRNKQMLARKQLLVYHNNWLLFISLAKAEFSSMFKVQTFLAKERKLVVTMKE